MSRNRILVVDDEVSIRMAIRRFLTGAGFEVSDAENRVSALAAARKERPDAIILDYQLRDCTALDLLPQFKAIDASVAVIILTAHGSVELAVSAIKEGAEQFLTKPVELPTLLVILNRTLDTQRSRQADQRTPRGRESTPPYRTTANSTSLPIANSTSGSIAMSIVVVFWPTAKSKGVPHAGGV